MYCYPYMVIGLLSWQVDCWDVAEINVLFDKALFTWTIEVESVSEHQLIVHPIYGTAMKSRTLRAIYRLLKVTISYGRPHTSYQNASAESLRAMLKGQIAFTEYLRTNETSRDCGTEFFQRYDEDQLYLGRDYITPSQVHNGAHLEIFARCNVLFGQNHFQNSKLQGRQLKIYSPSETTRLKHQVLEEIATTISTGAPTKQAIVAKRQSRNRERLAAGEGNHQKLRDHPSSPIPFSRTQPINVYSPSSTKLSLGERVSESNSGENLKVVFAATKIN